MEKPPHPELFAPAGKSKDRVAVVTRAVLPLNHRRFLL